MNTATQLELPAFLDQAPAPLPCREQPCLFDASDGDDAATAAEMCLDCPLMLACRDWARARRMPGVWGGETEAERIAATPQPRARATRKRGPAPKPACGTAAAARWHRRYSPDSKPCPPCLDAERTAHRERKRARLAGIVRDQHLLTPGELLTLNALAALGADRYEIADRIGTGPKTVDNHLLKLRRKLAVATNGEIIAAARSRAILPPAPGQPCHDGGAPLPSDAVHPERAAGEAL